jgi:8-oxo-dGTP pyrophosphatase MutT (NUDIX family)
MIRDGGRALPSLADPSALTLATVERALAACAPRTIDGNGYHRAAVALCLREAGGGLEVLLIHRAEHPEDRWSGHMALPGGRVEDDDRNPRAAAERETLEEVGVDLDRSGRHVGTLDEVQAMAKGRLLAMVITPHVYHLTEPVTVRLDETEVQGYAWIPVAPMLRGEYDSEVEWRYGPAGVMLPCFQVGPHTIWGLTHRMLTDFFGRLRA